MVTVNPDSDDKSYVFGPFRLIPSRQLLLRDGLPVTIGGRALDILTLLARHPGELVSKADILQFCWPRVFVHECNIKVHVAALRRVLRERRSETYIATVTGRGYRFVADVAVEETAAPRPTATPPTFPKPPLIGRTQELGEISDRLASARCVTIVGPAGVGKTAVALAVARCVRKTYPDGVYFVDLASVGDAQYVTAAIAASLGIKQRSEDALSELIALTRTRRMLLVLDSCEHLHATMTRIVNRLCEASPAVALLATSREPLWSRAEDVYRLSNLDTPAREAGVTVEDAMTFSSVRLFMSRAQECGGYVSDSEVPLVAAICRHLDGIPLAIELVASKTSAFGVSAVLAMLEQKFVRSGSGEYAAGPRQQTFLGILDWTYQLLSEHEAALLRSLSVFAGVFRLPDAVAMSELAGLNATQTVDVLERLVNKSLVYAEWREGSPSYRLLKSIRAYAAERLAEVGRKAAALKRHASHILGLFERAAEELDSRDIDEWMANYADRIDDARNAMCWAFDVSGDRMLGIRLTLAAIPLWFEISSLGEMQSRVERALLAAREQADCPSDLTLKLMAAKASGMSFSQHVSAAEAAWQDCYDLGVKTKNVKYELYGLWGLASHIGYMGNTHESMKYHRRFLALAERENDRAAIAEGQRSLALCEIYVGSIVSAKQRLEALVTQYERPSEQVHLARFQADGGVAIHCTLALALWASGEPSRALRIVRGVVERTDQSGHVVSRSNALARVGIPIAFWAGDFECCADFLNQLEENGRREDISMWREVSLFFASALDAKRRVPGAAVKVRKHVDALTATGHTMRAPMHYCMSAEAFLDVGALEDARSTIAVAREYAIRQSAKWCLPEILRIEALIARQSGDAGYAERMLRLAIAEASAVGALTLQLRAALSLCAKLEDDGNREEANRSLTAVVAQFGKDEAFADLIEAQRLLQQLNDGCSENVRV